MTTPLTNDAEAMARYYARRAQAYERIYAKPERQDDLRWLEHWLAQQAQGRTGLEIACGTGYWTRHAAPASAAWTATDINDEVLAIARAKAVAAPDLQFVRADAHALDVPARPWDMALAAFWWSHVDRRSIAAWIASLHGRLLPGARVVFIDNRYVEGSSTPLSRRDERGNTYQQRTLDDGSMHEIMKNFPDEAEVRAAIGPQAADVHWIERRHFWALSYVPSHAPSHVTSRTAR